MIAQYVMIGGFLGAGKTTAMIQLAKWLKERGIQTGLITNDQSSGLVDTALVRARGFTVEEIPGGCFCCKFSSLVEAAQRLSEDQTPDVFIAEPVGSCTDLVATVSYPLRRMYGEKYRIAPLSVLIDPIRAARIMGLEPGPKFSSKVIYVFEKQLEEADFIVINKSDLITQDKIEVLVNELQARFNPMEIFVCSCRNQTGLEHWFESIMNTELSEKATMDVDYELYAEGEALLGWLNATVNVSSGQEFDGNQFLQHLAGEIQRQVQQHNLEIAHLKITLIPSEGLGDIASINLVRNDLMPELSEQLQDPLQKGQLVINIRAESASTHLDAITRQCLSSSAAAMNLQTEIEHLEHFQPGKPVPEHRIVNAV